jgi:tetratricopeptide (TPR) repeat protein
MTRRGVGGGWRWGAGAALLLLALLGPVAPARGAATEGEAIAGLVRAADAAFGREDYATARRLYEQAVGAGADAAHALRRLALLQSWDGDLRQAIASYRRALERAPGDLDLSLELAKVLAWKNDLRGAIRLYEDLRAAHPEDARVLLGLGQALGWKGRYEQADAVYRSMQDRRLEPIQAHVGRARLLAWQGRLDRALEFYRDALRADPGNLDARIGMAQAEHWQGFDRKAVQQIDAIVLDHPGSREALDLQREIHDSQRPRAQLDGYRLSDNDGNRVDAAIAAHTFMAEPQTSIRIAYGEYDATVRCESNLLCDDLGLAEPFSVEAGDSARTLEAGVVSRIIGPILFHARGGAAQEETFGGDRRTVGIGGGFLRWQVGPRLALFGTGGREAILDTAPLIDRGLRVDTAEVRMEFRFRPAWMLSAGAGYGSYSDRNARRSAGLSIEWRLPVVRPKVAATFEARFREFNEDTDHGYFDPLRYDSELLTVAISDRDRRDRIFWRIEGTYGRQDFTTGGGSGPGAGEDDTVQAVHAALGVGLGRRGSLEAFYSRSDYALQVATGFTSTRSGLVFRLRF